MASTTLCRCSVSSRQLARTFATTSRRSALPPQTSTPSSYGPPSPLALLKDTLVAAAESKNPAALFQSSHTAAQEQLPASDFEARMSEVERELKARLVPPLEDPLLAQFIGLTTKHGLKQRARRLATDVLGLIRERTNKDPMPIFRAAIARASPLVSIKQVKVTAMKKADVPVALRERQRLRQGINAILIQANNVKTAEKITGRKMSERVATVMLQILMVDDASKQPERSPLLTKWKVHDQATRARSNVPGARNKR